MTLSAHLTLEEMVRSQTALRKGIDNTPTPDVIRRMEVWARTIFEPVRALLGVPLYINSGYRCEKLNRAVGGARTSQHLTGDAGDVVTIGRDLREAFAAIRRSSIPYDQLIVECDAWLHISGPREGAMPRRECLIATGSPGHWKYIAAPIGYGEPEAQLPETD